MAVVGVLALQGDFAKHLEALGRCGCEARPVRADKELEGCERLIIPGGESTTLGVLLQKADLDRAIRQKIAGGMPVWGTCMGMILLAKEIEGSDQFRFGVLDICVARNAFGAQVHSFEADLLVRGFESTFRAVFIRAPVVTRVGKDVEVLATYENKIVAVKQGCLLATAFHP
ncbi:MAG: pyridoxal 5'-phosphate synthase glutaminase subunit PdxT, partial [Candidatus Caldarchaeum sp.]